jgi:hypothetical protein
MAKIRNEGNRSDTLSFAAQVSNRIKTEEKTLRDFNSPIKAWDKDNRVDGTATRDHNRGTKPPEVTNAIAQDRGKDIHQRATQQKNNDRSP